MRLLKLVFFCFVLLFIHLFFLSAQTITVFDGNTPGVDTDWWTNSSQFTANWISTIDAVTWSIYEKWYMCNIQEQVGADWSSITADVRIESVPNTALPPDVCTLSGLTLSQGVHYRLQISAHHNSLVGGDITIISTNSDGFYVDTVAPSCSITPLPVTQAVNTFTVSWIGADDNGSGVESYDVQYRIPGGAWVDWQNAVTRTSAQFIGINGKTYEFRVRARDRVGHVGNYTSSNTTLINVIGADLSVTAIPAALSFGASETMRAYQLELRAGGAGSITINTIKENRVYPAWGTVSGSPEACLIVLTGGSTRIENRTLLLPQIDRFKALGTNTEGNFTVNLELRGTDNLGNPVLSAVSIPVQVSGSLQSAFTVQSIQVNLPPSPYYVGDVVANATVTINATGNGSVQGQILVDGSPAWSQNPNFSVTVNGTTSFTIQGTIPTSDPGTHTVQVVLSAPVALTAAAEYTISTETPPFPPAKLTLVPDVAELSGFQGTALATSDNNAGFTEFSFSGTAHMKLLSLQNTVIQDAGVSNLIIRYYHSAPAVAQVRGGIVEKTAGSGTPFVTTADGYLKINAVRFTGQATPATDHILVGAELHLKKINQDLIHLENLVVRANGVEAKTYSWSVSAPRTFSAFGMEFALHDVGGSAPALLLDKVAGENHYFFRMSGSVLLNEKRGTVVQSRQLTTFQALTFYSNDTVDGLIAFNAPFELMPGKLVFNEIRIAAEANTFKMKLKGQLANLPEPFNSLQPVPFEFLFDKNGNTEGSVIPIRELAANNLGHNLGSGDSTEWDLGIGTLDITFLMLHLVFSGGEWLRDQSELRIGSDLYLDLKNPDNTVPAPNERRISFGELNSNGDFTGGVRVAMDGGFTWHQPTNTAVIQNKELALSALTIKIAALGVLPAPFQFIFTGEVVIGMTGVTGSIGFENLAVGLDGVPANLSDALTGGVIAVKGIVRIDVDDINWSTTPTTITFDANNSSGQGANQTIARQEKSVAVASYFQLLGSAVNIGPSGSPALSGNFDNLTVYKTPGGEQGFVLLGADVQTTGVRLYADIEYTSSLLQVSGGIELPNNIEAVAVGKMGTQNGEFTMGVFIAASGLNVAVGPGVFLDEIGGGFFINPLQEDIDLVRSISEFTRPELDDEIQAKRPGGAGNPGDFALMLLGGFYIVDKNNLKGRALVTITANYFNLDAEVHYASGLVDGTAYLAIGWNPAYAEGRIEIEMDFLSLIEGEGNLEFYVYSKDTWGVSGNFNVSLLGQDLASGTLFIGPPGFLLETKVGISIDLVIVSGSISFEGMFWYNRTVNPANWGAYASVEVKGEFLKGLLGASARLEAALIGAPEFVLYAVGTVSFKVCYVTVFKGSLWISVGINGLHGGKGRNDHYDGLIEDARNIANQMNQARDQLMGDLDAAQLELARLNAAQAAAAGLTLVDSGGLKSALVAVIFEYNELNHWNTLPNGLLTIREELFGAAQQYIVQARTEIQQLQGTINSKLTALQTLQQAVAERLGDYEDLLVEKLPSIQDLSSPGNPFEGMQTKTVNIGGVSKQITTGFKLNESKAGSRRNQFTSLRESFAAYQDSFIGQAGVIDAKLQLLDQILFNTENNLLALTGSYSAEYALMAGYINRFVQFQGDNYKAADQSLSRIQGAVSEAQLRSLLQTKAASLTEAARTSWNNDRIALINALVSAGGEQPAPYNSGISSTQLFIETGVDLWRNIPIAGFTASRDLSPERRGNALVAFKKSADAFRSKWVSTTTLVNTVFERKAMLYDILYEIYDQLGTFGTGMIGVSGTGYAAGFPGLQGMGLAFRSSALAASVLGSASTLPDTLNQPGAPVIGPLRPGTRKSPQQTLPGKKATGKAENRFRYNLTRFTLDTELFKHLEAITLPVPRFNFKTDTVNIPAPGNENRVTVAQKGKTGVKSNSTSGAAALTGNNSAFSTLQLVDAPQNLPQAISLDRNVAQAESAPADTPVYWVPVTAYFGLKKLEIIPYIEIPEVAAFTGSVESRTEYNALLTAAFSGTHPAGVVEYAYKIEPAPATTDSNASSGLISQFVFTGFAISNSEQAANQPNPQPGTSPLLFANPMLLSAVILRPWFSVGNQNTILEPFFPDLHQAGTYYLYLRVRGAGGKSITRRATLALNYFNPATNTGPVVSQINTSDTTPPAMPLVILSAPYSAQRETLYARWEASDPESGIQQYEYSVGSYTENQARAVNQKTGAETTGIESAYSAINGFDALVSGAPAGASVKTDILGWTKAQGLTEVIIKNLNLVHNKSYVVNCRVTNGVGLKAVGSSSPVRIDTTPPTGLKIDEFTQAAVDGYSNSISFRFTPGSDPESGIVNHTIGLGKTRGSADLFPWTVLAENKAYIVNLPLAEADTLFLTLIAENGAGLTREVSGSLKIVYNDTTPPASPLVVMLPEQFTAGGADLQMGWYTVSDAESGIMQYEYGLGTAPGNPDVINWTIVENNILPYLTGKNSVPGQELRENTGNDKDSGEQLFGMTGGKDSPGSGTARTGNALRTDFVVKLPALNLTQGTAYYGMVRVTNGKGLKTVGNARALVMDKTPPQNLSLTAAAETTDKTRLTVHLQAKDNESGIAGIKYAVWKADATAMLESGSHYLEYIVPVSSGFVSQNNLQGTFQSQGALSADLQPQPGSFLQDLPSADLQAISTPPWFESGWEVVAGGANPAGIDLDVVLPHFPRPGLQTGKTYTIRIWVRNGAGLITQTAPVTIKVVNKITGSTQDLDNKPKVNPGIKTLKL